MLIDDDTIDQIAKHINNRINSPPLINVSSSEGNSFTPQYFEIVPSKDIDNINTRFYAIDGSYNCQDFYNGVSVALYAAGDMATHTSEWHTLVVYHPCSAEMGHWLPHNQFYG